MNKYKFLVEPIWDTNLVESLVSATLNGKLIYSKLVELNLKFNLIQKGTSLISRVSDDLGATPLESNSKISLEHVYSIDDIGDNISNMLGGKNYLADFDGIFFIIDNVPQLLEINYNGAYKLNVSEDKMQVMLDLFPPSSEGKKFLFKQLFEELLQFGLKTEIDGQAIEAGITSLEGKELPLYNIKIATGFQPLDGVDGKIEYFVNTKVDFSPQVDNDGRVDFYNLNIINSVEKGQDLVLYHPHIEERDGKNVFGDLIPARKARVIKFPQGKNTYTESENPNLLKSKVDGIIIEKDGIISVSEIYKINGNVDYSTGNINNKGSVSVLGDVKSGFSMEVNDAVDVRGIVEDCVIKAGADVRVTSGFSGKGKGVIFSQGNVDVRYVRNQRIHSRKSINVSNEVFDSELFAAHRIQVAGGRNMSILGGYTIAGNTIEVNCLGNEYGVKTIVEAGFDYNLISRVKKNIDEISQLEATLINVDEGLTKLITRLHLPSEIKKTLSILMQQKIILYENQKKFEDFDLRKDKLNLGIEKILKSAKLDSTGFSNIITLFDQKIIIRKKIKILENNNREIDILIHTPTKSKIKVNRTIYPGSTILINKVKFVVKEPLLNKVFYLGNEGKEILLA